MIEVKSDCEHDKFGYIPIEDSSILQNIFDLLVQVEQTQVEDCGSLEFELSLKDSIRLFHTLLRIKHPRLWDKDDQPIVYLFKNHMIARKLS